MGRSRVNFGDDDNNHRSKRRRVASGGEALENISSGPGTNEGKKALYHCNSCNKDITGKIRIKCAKCPDFDLCVECFSVGAEVTPHRSNHPYRVMDNLSFPLICPDWNADEEILLLEGIEMYGIGNWADVAEHVGTKSKAQCIDHYTTAYMNSPCYPLPDMSRVNGKNRKELLAMAKVQDIKKGILSGPLDITPKAETPFSPARVKVEDFGGEAVPGRPPSGISAVANKKASNVGHLKDGPDGTKPEDAHVDRSIGITKPRCSGDEGPSMTELSGYNPKRQEFDPEYDNDAEQSLAEMEFKDNDSETDRELKLRVLRIYLSRLDERKKRKEFILERNLLFPNPLEKDLSNDDKDVYHRFKVFMRFLSQEEHGVLVRYAVEDRKMRKRIQELQASRSAGCHTIAEAKAYIDQKRRKEYELSAQKAKESGQGTGVPKVMQKAGRSLKTESDGSPRGNIDPKKGALSLDSGARDSPAAMGNSTAKSWDDWDISGFPGSDLLSSSEQVLCCQNRLLPSHYLKMQEVLVQEIFKGSVLKKADAHGLFKVDPGKIDKVYDMVTKKLGHNDEPQVV